MTTTEKIAKLSLRSKTDPSFSIEVGPQVIEACSILQHVATLTDNSAAIDVDMTPKQLKKYVEFLNHFETPESPNDFEFSNSFFEQFNDEEFSDFCWKANYLDSQRFLEAAGQFAIERMRDMEVEEIQDYLNIVDDYTPEEREAMDEYPLEYYADATEAFLKPNSQR